jgi:transposase-like protein
MQSNCLSGFIGGNSNEAVASGGPVEQKAAETLTYFAYPSTHWRQIRTNNPLERIIVSV